MTGSGRRASRLPSADALRVVVTGSHGVGKTSLVTALSQSLEREKSVQVVPEIARLLVAAGYDVNDRMNLAGFLRYLQLFLRSMRETREDLVLFDRSLVDLYIYTRHNPSIPAEARDLLQELMLCEFSLVHEYVYVPVEFELASDEVRPADRAYQRQIDLAIRKLLGGSRVAFVEASGSLEERCRFLCARYSG